jgi:hypothetical protein
MPFRLLRHGLFVGLLSLVLTACGSIKVTGQVNATLNTSIQNVAEIAFTRADLESSGQDYLHAQAGRPETERVLDPAAQLQVQITGNPGPGNLQETYHFLQVTTLAGQLDRGTSNDRSFVVQNIGSVIHLAARPEQARVGGVANGLLHIGATWLAVVKDEFRVVPWQVQVGAANCFDVQGDCLDMQTFTHELFLSIATQISNTVGAEVPFGATVRHRLHYVPRVVHSGLEATGERARGFGLVYYARIEAPLTALDVYVPLSVLFIGEGSGVLADYRVAVDPLSFVNTATRQESLDRVYVKGELAGGLAEGFVRDKIVEALRHFEPPRELLSRLPRGLSLETALAAGFAFIAGPTPTSGQPLRVSSRYEAILLPDINEAALGSTILWQREGNSGAVVEVQPVRLVFLEPDNSRSR